MTRTLLVCVNPGVRPDRPACGRRGSEAIADALEAGIRERGIDIVFERLRCFGWCSRGPNLRIEGGPAMYGVTLDDVPRILDALAQPEPGLPS